MTYLMAARRYLGNDLLILNRRRSVQHWIVIVPLCPLW
jgi:hypothetical protein